MTSTKTVPILRVKKLRLIGFKQCVTLVKQLTRAETGLHPQPDPLLRCLRSVERPGEGRLGEPEPAMLECQAMELGCSKDNRESLKVFERGSEMIRAVFGILIWQQTIKRVRSS